MLNLFFPLLLCFLIYSDYQNIEEQKYLYTILGGITLTLYTWWYSKQTLWALYVLFYLGVNVYLILKDKISVKDFFLRMGLFILLGNPYNIVNLVPSFYNHVKGYIFRSEIKKGFPSDLNVILENQNGVNLWDRLKNLHDFRIIAVLGIVGIIWGVIRYKKYDELIFLIPMFLVGSISLISGSRFAMYLGVFIGLGIGILVNEIVYLIDKSFSLDKKYVNLSSLLLSFIFLISLFPYKQMLYVPTTWIPKELHTQLYRLREETDPTAQIWTWWDYGGVIQYYGERASFSDPQIHGSIISFSQAKSLWATSDLQESKEIIKKYSCISEELESASSKEEKQIKGSLSTLDDIKDYDCSFDRDVSQYILSTNRDLRVAKTLKPLYFEGAGDYMYANPKCRSHERGLKCFPDIIVDESTLEIYKGNMTMKINELLYFSAEGEITEKKINEIEEGTVGIWVEPDNSDGIVEFYVLGQDLYKSVVGQIMFNPEYREKNCKESFGKTGVAMFCLPK